MKRPIAPWKLALLAFVITCVVLGIALYAPARGASPFENGKALGDKLGGPAFGAAIIAWAVQRYRVRRFELDNRKPQ
jgi:hypothetical protein